MSKKYVYLFSEGDSSMKNLLGGKGACNQYYEDGKVLTSSIEQEIYETMKKLESITGKQFGGTTNPLLVSVRSGARVSMPGMMDTILNLGLNDEVVEVISKSTNNERFAYDSYRRFIQMFSDVVMGIEKKSTIRKRKAKIFQVILRNN